MSRKIRFITNELGQIEPVEKTDRIIMAGDTLVGSDGSEYVVDRIVAKHSPTAVVYTDADVRQLRPVNSF